MKQDDLYEVLAEEEERTLDLDDSEESNQSGYNTGRKCMGNTPELKGTLARDFFL